MLLMVRMMLLLLGLSPFPPAMLDSRARAAASPSPSPLIFITTQALSEGRVVRKRALRLL